jgi:hypothetical protein
MDTGLIQVSSFLLFLNSMPKLSDHRRDVLHYTRTPPGHLNNLSVVGMSSSLTLAPDHLDRGRATQAAEITNGPANSVQQVDNLKDNRHSGPEKRSDIRTAAHKHRDGESAKDDLQRGATVTTHAQPPLRQKNKPSSKITTKIPLRDNPSERQP